MFRPIAAPTTRQPSLHGLVATGFEKQDPVRSERSLGWEGGFQVDAEGCAWAFSQPVDCTDGPDQPDDNPHADAYPVDTFTIESIYECGTTGFLSIDYRGRAIRNLEAWTSKLLEWNLWTGENLPADSVSPHLTFDASILAGGDALAPLEALSVLGQALSACSDGGRGMIHAPSFMVDRWLSDDVLREDAQRLRTIGRGDYVVRGDGYPGTGPGGIAPDTSIQQTWVYATGLVDYRLAEPYIVEGDDEFAGFDRRTNTMHLTARRLAAVNFDPCCHFAVLVEPCPQTGVPS